MPQMPSIRVFLLKMMKVRKREPLHNARKPFLLLYPCKNMKVCRHECIMMDEDQLVGSVFLEHVFEGEEIVIISKQPNLVVAAADDMQHARGG